MNTRFWALVFSVLAFDVHEAGSQGREEDILDAAAMLPGLLHSCELTYQNIIPSREVPGEYTLKVDGDRFYIHLPVGEGSASGFDGETHWVQDEGERSRAAYSEGDFSGYKQRDLHPLIVMYTWFFGSPHSAVWAELKSASAWSDIRSRLSFIDTRSILGQDCDVFSIEHEGKEYRVAFSRELNGFPVQCELYKNGKLYTTSSVVKSYTHDSGAVIPLEIRAVRPNGDFIATKLVDQSSVKVNEFIEPEIFSLDPTKSKIVQDLDQIPVVAGEVPVPTGRYSQLLVGIGLIAVVSSVVFFVWKKRR